MIDGIDDGSNEVIAVGGAGGDVNKKRRVRGKAKIKQNKEPIVFNGFPGETKRVLFLITPMNRNDSIPHLRLRLDTQEMARIWAYVNTFYNSPTHAPFLGVEADGIVGFGDEMMIVAMEFLCSCLNAKYDINHSGDDGHLVSNGRVRDDKFSSKLVPMLNICHFMSSRCGTCM